ncbi:MAG: dienelactone hydrolase family protein [Betaproteobacteria bacterium]|nr:dienelactone hydrolase family protein [Betaproteobacteria bacterium]
MIAAHPQPPRDEREVDIPLDGRIHRGTLRMPEQASGLVLFAHGSGSSRFSPRNTLVARVLGQAGFASLLFDLLTEGEDRVIDARFDIPLLAQRLVGATAWSAAQPELARLPLGYFGASTGAAAALVAAAHEPRVQAVVSRGGRPDLAMDKLPRVTAPTLLIVGGLDDVVIELNRHAAARMQVEHELVIVPGASHLFEEPGTLEQAAGLAAQWFARHLAAPRGAAPA